MAIQTWISREGVGRSRRNLRILVLVGLAFFLVFYGSIACKKAEEADIEEEAVTLEEGVIAFEGAVKLAVSKYLYIPEVQGFDIVVQGSLESGDVSSLVGKEVRGQGEFTSEKPSVLVVNTIEVKDEAGEWSPVFTRTEDALFEDFLDLNTRNEFKKLESLAYDKKDGWEGKGRAKVYGKLEQEGDAFKIAVLNDAGKETGKILVDSISDFSRYYIQKLGIFDRFWFYLSIKDTVDWSQRRRSREMFHADILFIGLF